MSGRGAGSQTRSDARSTAGRDARPAPAPARRLVARPLVPRSLAVIRRAAGHRPPAAPIIRIAARSAVAPTPGAGQTAAIPTLAVAGRDEHASQPQSRRLSSLRRRLAALAAAGLVVAAAALAAGGTRVVLATFTDEAAVAGTFTTGTWTTPTPTTWYLHNDPTPPAGPTSAQPLLALDEVAPTAATLYNYDTDCDGRIGRLVRRGSGLVSEAGACRSATWRSAPLTAPRILDGTATLSVWARKAVSGGTNPTLTAFLRLFDPATSTWTELGTAGAAVARNANQSWAALSLSWSLDGITVPAGTRIEVTIVSSGGTRDPEIAYDTTDQPSSLTLP